MPHKYSSPSLGARISGSIQSGKHRKGSTGIFIHNLVALVSIENEVFRVINVSFKSMFNNRLNDNLVK